MAEATATRRPWWVYLLGTVMAVAMLVPLAALTYWGIHLNLAAREARRLREGLEPALTSAKAELARTGHCPVRFEDFNPPPGARYACALSGDHFWVSFPDQSGLMVPTDLFFEYDSRTSKWELLDWGMTQTAHDTGATLGPRPPS